MHERDVLKVDFFPKKIPFPSFSRDDYLKQTAEDLLHLLQDASPASTVHEPLSFGPPILNAFARVAKILGRAVSLPKSIHNQVTATLPTATPSPAVEPITKVLPVSLPRVPVSLPRVPVSLPRVPVTAMTVPNINQLPPPKSIVESPKPHPGPTLRSSLRSHVVRHIDPRTHQYLVQSAQYDPSIAGKMYNPETGKAENIDSLLRGRHSDKWYASLTNEWGRLCQGLTKTRKPTEQIVGNNTMFFIFPHQVPPGRKVTYAQFVCTMRPTKPEPWRIRMTVGGNLLDAYIDVRSPAVGLIDVKCHWNSVISDAHKGARYCTADLKDFFLVSTMPVYQYMRIHRKYLTNEIFDEYGLTDAHFDSKDYIYVEIRKGMYGLKEAAILAFEQLRDHLAPFGYHPVKHTPGLWSHETLKTTFTLAVDDFGIKYFSKTDADHLFNALAT